ncbi:DUF4179 domain-containing protein [Clostridium gasigenes]|uniref:DUF4179 domain-containing protein n=1 Tax=Clostridium gasigenes TaxID=94869 RepID=UPI00143844E4|nr:DUF4179 domain-containing protein [Clostridium gasigenes]NKF07334.1 DUF4179 domain-containing protein [Clostridium gasigenes]QSW18307.1 DUF4179 domain-containing protein [Clostridium gasigenes]
MDPKKILDNIDNLDINDIEMSDIDITEIENERVKKNVKATIANREISKENGNNNYRRYVVAATLIITILIGLTPRVSAEIKKIIFSFNNPGVEAAVDSGYVQSIDEVAMSNEDMDIKLENIMIDKSKIALDFFITFKDEEILKMSEGSSNAKIELYDENDNIIVKEGVVGIFGGSKVNLEKISDSENTARLKVLLSSSVARIPKIDRLKVKFNSIMIREKINMDRYDKDLNWSFEIDVDDKFKETSTTEYSYENNNSNIKINKVEVLPTGVHLEYEYFPVGHYENIVHYSEVVAEDGRRYKLSDGASGKTGDNGEYIISGVFNGISSFENIEKFTLEIPTPDKEKIDKIEFIKNK